MRRSLPTFLCIALATGLSACDEPVDGPSTDDEQELYEFRGAPAPANLDGDLTMTRASKGGGDIIDFDLINNAVYRGGDGALVGELNGDTLSDGSGTDVCTIGSDGTFTTLSDASGVVLYSTLGKWVFSGDVDIDGLTPPEAYQVLSNSLLVTFDDIEVIDGLPSDGDPVAESSAVLDFASAERKLVITAMLDGACGGEALPESGI